MLIGLPREGYTVSVLSKIGDLLEELDYIGRKEALKRFISQLLIKTGQVEGMARRDLLGIIMDFIKEPFSGSAQTHLQIASRIGFILEGIENEAEPVMLAHLLKISQEIIDSFMVALPESRDIILGLESPAAKRYFLFIDQLFSSFHKRLKREEVWESKISELIKNFILDISNPEFLQILIYRIIDVGTKNKYDARQIYHIIGDRFIDTLIDLATEQNADLKDPFREFLMKKRISDLLIELKDVSADRLKNILSEMKEETSAHLIELIGYLKNEELVDLLLSFIHHKDSVIRVATVMALSGIGGEKSIAILSRVVNEEPDEKIRDLASSKLQKLKGQTPPKEE
jgi:hypothetical protein